MVKTPVLAAEEREVGATEDELAKVIGAILEELGVSEVVADC